MTDAVFAPEGKVLAHLTHKVLYKHPYMAGEKIKQTQ